MSNPDLEALVTPKIAEAIQAAIENIGRGEFLKITSIDDQMLGKILKADEEEYVTVGLVTITCQINKSHNDPDLAHSSVTECLKGTTIRIPSNAEQVQSSTVQGSRSRIRFQKTRIDTASNAPLLEKKTFRLLGFSANTIAFLILGYFLGGVGISPIIGQSSCTGVSVSPPSLVPCSGSIIGLVISAIGGLGYTYYYFVKKL